MSEQLALHQGLRDRSGRERYGPRGQPRPPGRAVGAYGDAPLQSLLRVAPPFSVFSLSTLAAQPAEGLRAVDGRLERVHHAVSQVHEHDGAQDLRALLLVEVLFELRDDFPVLDVPLGARPCAGVCDCRPSPFIVVALAGRIQAANLVRTQSGLSPKLGVSIKSRPAVIGIGDAQAYLLPECGGQLIAGPGLWVRAAFPEPVCVAAAADPTRC